MNDLGMTIMITIFGLLAFWLTGLTVIGIIEWWRWRDCGSQKTDGKE